MKKKKKKKRADVILKEEDVAPKPGNPESIVRENQMQTFKEMSTKDVLTLSKRFLSCFGLKLFVRFDLSLQLRRSLSPPFLFGQNSQQPEMSPTPEDQQSQLCVPSSWSWGRSTAQLLVPFSRLPSPDGAGRARGGLPAQPFLLLLQNIL